MEDNKKDEPKKNKTGDTHRQKTPISKKIDSSEVESKKLISQKKGKELGGDSEQVTSYFKIDEKTEKQIKDLLQEDLKNEVQDIKKDFLIIFGLFASFVTFISINVQVFKNSTNPFEIIGVISISLSFIIFFALVINSVVKNQVEWSDLKQPIYIINLLFLIIGVVFISYGEKRNNNKIEDLNQKIVIDSLDIEKVSNIIDSLNNQLIYRDSTISELLESVKELKIDYKEFKKKKETNKAMPNKDLLIN